MSSALPYRLVLPSPVTPVSNQSHSPVAKVFAAILGVGACGVAYLIIMKSINNKKARDEEKLVFEMGKAAMYAQRLRMAFDNDGLWGTNMDKVREIIRDIPSRDIFRQVNDSYARLYNNASMLADMKSELQSTEYDEMLFIVAAKPEKDNGPVTLDYGAWARRLKAAFDKTYGPFPGTDDEAIRAVFLEIPTKRDFELVKRAYADRYGSDFMTDYKSEMRWGFDHDYIDVINKKPD